MPYKDPQQKKAYQAEYRRTHRQKCHEYQAKYRKTHEQEIKAYATTPEARLRRREKRAENLEKCREAERRWREENPDRIRNYNNKPERKAHLRIKRQEIREQIWAIKLHYGCCDPRCKWVGEYSPEMLDFHHIDDNTKTSCVALLVKTGWTAELIDEINKCTVVCSNCHRKATYSDDDKQQYRKCCLDSDGNLSEPNT